MRCIGKGAESAVMFCGIMNLPPPPTKFNNNLLQAARETCEESMAEAVHEAVEENEGGRDIAVAVDGSWQKRGFSSKNGVVTVTSVDTGKVIDVEILSKHCICPNKTKHLQNCKRNFVGYSGKMEVTVFEYENDNTYNDVHDRASFELKISMKEWGGIDFVPAKHNRKRSN
ncbi:uncharacterized protein NPIL_130921 [Nephila pilipes]|uniref:Mutator-like transposase domain-containing protein n=1 Tax=Nephila pilipes TaxID=299642 RepID=A0A8X6NVL8_NEPPI|nr:uncharacterized protein NPIL_130921 [Nephila pilipes]